MYFLIIFVLVIFAWASRKFLASVYLVVKSGYTLLKNPDRYPDIFRVRLSSKRCYYISKPEYFEKVLSSPYAIDKAELYSYLEKFAGPNIFTASENMWKKQRKILNHSFSQKRIDSYSRVFIDEAESLAYRLSKLVVRRNRDVQNVVLTCFTNTICRTLFDVKYEMDIETHVRELDRLLGNVARRGVRWFSHWSTPTSSVTEEFEKSWSYGKQIGGDIISEKRRQLAEIKELTEVGIDLERTKETFMLDNILERPEFTDQRAMSELLLFIIAGSETSSSTLLFTFIALAIYPDIQERLYEDVVKVCGLDGPVTLEHLSHVEYVERVIKETLRIFAVAPILGRYIQEDLHIGNMVLPKGSTVFLNVIHTHRNAKYWPDPLKFDPDRFLQKNASKIVPFSFIPFSHGFRNCIGHKYAMTSLKITLITIIRKVKIFTAYKTIGEVRVKSHFTLRPMMGWKLWFEARS